MNAKTPLILALGALLAGTASAAAPAAGPNEATAALRAAGHAEVRELEFDDVEELRKWASAGGFWASGSDQQPC